MRKEAEVISHCKQGIPVHPVPALSIKISQYPPVFPQESMNIPYKVVCIAVKAVIVIVSALVGAEFLITAAAYLFAAIETFSFHSTNVCIKI